MKTTSKYTLLASLFDYPDHRASQICNEIGRLFQSSASDASEPFGRFELPLLAMNQRQREEYFISTFDIDAVTSMDLGYLLFGEDYKRGNFLSMMKHEQLEAGNDPGSELADHLPNVLRLLPMMKDQEMAAELAFSIVIPAVKAILMKFGDRENIYRHAFETLLMLLESDFDGLAYETCPIQSGATECPASEYACGADFLNEIGKQKF